VRVCACRRFVWKQFQFVMFRSQVHHVMRTCFTAWKFRGLPPEPLSLSPPLVSLAQCRELMQFVEEGGKLEDEWDERVMRRMLVCPPPSTAVLNKARPGGVGVGVGVGLGLAAGSLARLGATATSLRDGSARMDRGASARVDAGAGAGAGRVGTPDGGPADGTDGPVRPRRPSDVMAAAYMVDIGSDAVVDSPLHAAADEGNEAEVRRLLQAGFDPNARNHRLQVWRVAFVCTSTVHGVLSYSRSHCGCSAWCVLALPCRRRCTSRRATTR
jgi:hypothetical protein